MTIHGSIPTIETDRLLLRQLNQNDTDAIFQLYSDYEVIKYDGGIMMTARWQAEQFVATFGNAVSFIRRQFVTWGFIEKTSQRLIGVGGLKNWNGRLVAEIGLDLMRGFWSQGYGKEIISALTVYSFREFGLYKIYAIMMPQNKAAIRLFEKLGFIFVRKLTHYPYAYTYTDVLLYQLVNEGEL